MDRRSVWSITNVNVSTYDALTEKVIERLTDKSPKFREWIRLLGGNDRAAAKLFFVGKEEESRFSVVIHSYWISDSKNLNLKLRVDDKDRAEQWLKRTT